MEKKLRATPLVVQLPLEQGRDFTGVLDLLTMDVLTWTKGGDGRNFTHVPLITHTNEDGNKDFKQLSSKQLIDRLNAENLPLDSKLVSEALDKRYNLAEQVSEISVHILHIRKERQEFNFETTFPRHDYAVLGCDIGQSTGGGASRPRL
jgi:peptide subunit release factor RF-3